MRTRSDCHPIRWEISSRRWVAAAGYSGLRPGGGTGGAGTAAAASGASGAYFLWKRVDYPPLFVTSGRLIYHLHRTSRKSYDQELEGMILCDLDCG